MLRWRGMFVSFQRGHAGRSLYLGDSLTIEKSPTTKATPLGVAFVQWCPGRDLNSHGFPHTPLKRTCLPIPPPGHSSISFVVLRYFFGSVAGAVPPPSGWGCVPPPAGAGAGGAPPGAGGGAVAAALRAASCMMLRCA